MKYIEFWNVNSFFIIFIQILLIKGGLFKNGFEHILMFRMLHGIIH